VAGTGRCFSAIDARKLDGFARQAEVIALYWRSDALRATSAPQTDGSTPRNAQLDR
jgi:hypothetical protein